MENSFTGGKSSEQKEAKSYETANNLLSRHAYPLEFNKKIPKHENKNLES